jgi:hypothetical protein
VSGFRLTKSHIVILLGVENDYSRKLKAAIPAGFTDSIYRKSSQPGLAEQPAAVKFPRPAAL